MEACRPFLGLGNQRPHQKAPPLDPSLLERDRMPGTSPPPSSSAPLVAWEHYWEGVVALLVGTGGNWLSGCC
jgi:hypothetical protein